MAEIARRAGAYEERGVTSGQYTPCSVAASVAITDIRSGMELPVHDGWLSVTLLVVTGKPYLGRFYCEGETTPLGTPAETCAHSSDRRLGSIVVRFTIMRAATGSRTSDAVTTPNSAAR
jgi:hypothetical protein